MVLPILMLVSVTPGPYILSASAVLAASPMAAMAAKVIANFLPVFISFLLLDYPRAKNAGVRDSLNPLSHPAGYFCFYEIHQAGEARRHDVDDENKNNAEN